MTRQLAVVLIASASIAGLLALTRSGRPSAIPVRTALSPARRTIDPDTRAPIAPPPPATTPAPDAAALQELEAANNAVQDATAEVRKLDAEMATLQTKASELSAGEIRYGTAKLEANLEAHSHQSTARTSFQSQSEYNAARKAESAAVASAETARANAAQVMVDMDILQMRALTAQANLRTALNRREAALAAVSTH